MNFDQNNRISGDIPPSDESPLNIHWKDEFADQGLDLSTLSHDERQVSVLPGRRINLKQIDHLKVGDSVEGMLEKPSGDQVPIAGTVLGFVAISRTAQTFFFAAEVQLSAEVPYENSLARRIFRPIEKLKLSDSPTPDKAS